VSEIATKRLEAIREYAEFGAGFKIALRDLEIRGAGNILGAEQHGHLDAVGYDLYIKLLNEAVLEERGEKIEEKIESTISLKCDAYIPEKYVSYSSQRMELYKKIANIETPEDKEDIIDEMIDRFGDIPAATQNLLTVALVRSAAVKCRISSVVEDGSEIKIYPVELDIGVWSDLAFEYKGRLSVTMAETPYLKLRKQSKENVPELLYALFSRYIELATAEKEISQM
jgi:transcription-repair coupling factor (superfamily II helicase)